VVAVVAEHEDVLGLVQAPCDARLDVGQQRGLLFGRERGQLFLGCGQVLLNRVGFGNDVEVFLFFRGRQVDGQRIRPLHGPEPPTDDQQTDRNAGHEREG